MFRNVLFTVFLFCSVDGFSSGMAVHIWIADLAKDRVQHEELYEVLQNETALYRNGSIFPDTGYAIDHPYGEYSHWHEYLNESRVRHDVTSGGVMKM